MGSNGSTRRVSLEADENENVTVVKGVRLSENVINRMRDSSSKFPQQPSQASPSPQTNQLLTPLLPSQPVFERTSPPLPTHQAPPTVDSADEEELRRKIREELQRGRSRAEGELRKRLEEEAQVQLQQEAGKILEVEQATAQNNIKQARTKERLTAEDERLRAELNVQKLEQRDRDLRKQDAFYKEQLAKLEQRSARFYEVSTKSYHKAVEEVSSKFRRYEINPVCTDLQELILQCYKENSGQTLTCSNIASLYLQCVNNAKQNKVTGG
ncbi:coiled-coil-helix-coiled-coil-helix domain containing 3a isoform X2 [Brienomyrus brachyistius]|uniref:coiled-coil-helix-coiled-coil-helix domain containing 3a isoform X2 n=1 Tax=Brienomyrus brachyistius TaxID=42636 RepID=UPI0020B3926E|nr:coiled-coil-helix-coiled-coil-helix domain containing 3a isoform X2 [Brienomyrus brachyistius]